MRRMALREAPCERGEAAKALRDDRRERRAAGSCRRLGARERLEAPAQPAVSDESTRWRAAASAVTTGGVKVASAGLHHPQANRALSFDLRAAKPRHGTM
eukprot:364887-Chlamydomonas_euryale.AAC.9